jgi:1,4-dihydroxy-2-naphthoate octaprenyltransferase
MKKEKMKETHTLSGQQARPAQWKVWLKTSRPFTLTATVSPLLVGTALAAYSHAFRLDIFLLTFFSCLFLQIGTNYFNEYFDYRYGLDHAGSLGAMTVIFRNEMTAGEVLAGGVISFAIAVVLGIVLIFLVGPVIILFGLAGMLIAYFYSAKPFKFASRGLGDILVYIAMGFLMTWDAYFVQLHQWSWSAFAASVPVGFLVTAILNMNNVRDYQDDRAVNKKTLPVRFGLKFGQRFHATLLFGSYVAASIFVLVGLLPWFSLLVWLTFPLAFSNVRSVLGATDRKAFIVGIKRTAMLHLIFGVVFAAAILIAML